MDKLKDKRGFRIHLLHQIVNLQNKEQGFSQFYCAALTKHFSVDSYDLKYMSFKFSNDIFITFEMATSSFIAMFWKITFRCYSVHL